MRSCVNSSSPDASQLPYQAGVPMWMLSTLHWTTYKYYVILKRVLVVYAILFCDQEVVVYHFRIDSLSTMNEFNC